MHILFVCSGNTCRSPMAEALFTDLFAKMRKSRQGTEVIARSAGLFAFDGQPANRDAVAVMAEMGIDISKHRTKSLDEDLVQWADLILTMTEAQYREIMECYHVPSTKVKVLGKFSLGSQEDVVDPFGSGIGTYRRCVKQIRNMIIEVVKKFS